MLTKNKYNIYNFWILAIIFFSFAPYLMFGAPIPIAPCFIYIAFLALFIMNRLQLPIIAPELSIFAYLLSFILIISIISTLYNSLNLNFPLIKQLSQFESSFRLLFLLGVFSYMRKLDYKHWQKIFFKASYILLFLLFINTVISIFTIFKPSIIDDLIIFHSYLTNQLTVAYKAAVAGRYVGLFNQPVIAGFVYSLATLFWVYLYRQKGKILVIDYMLLLSLLIGNVLVFSKVSLIIGMPLVIIYGLCKKPVFNFKIFITVMVFIVITIIFFGILNEKSYFYYFMRLPFQHDIFSAITSYRYGAHSNGYMLKTISQYNPLLGSGYGVTLFDSGYLYYFLIGGPMCLLSFILIMFYVFLLSMKKLAFEEGRLLLFVFLLFAIANLGAPIAVAPKGSIIFWTFLFILVYLNALVGSDESISIC